MNASRRYPRIGTLGKRYQVLGHAIDLRVPGFSAMDRYNLRTFAPEPVGSFEWFKSFTDLVEMSIGRSFLPVLRLADGEFLFLFGFQPPSFRLGMRYPLALARWICAKYRPRHELVAGGSHARRPLYASGRYSLEEVRRIRDVYARVVSLVSQRGCVAADLSFCAVPFQEQFFPAFKKWISNNHIILTTRNYLPFYFVYALLTGPERGRILRGRRILVIHSAVGEKQESIRSRLLHEGAADVLWQSISAERSLEDMIPVEQFVGRIDLCVFGAGIGKAAILEQLEPLGVPCIDAGYVMEVWADPAVAASRIFTQPDEPTMATVGADSQ